MSIELKKELFSDSVWDTLKNETPENIAEMLTSGLHLRNKQLITQLNYKNKLIEEVNSDNNFDYSMIQSFMEMRKLQPAEAYKYSPVRIGQVGEAYVRDILSRNYKINDTSKTTASGDIIIKELNSENKILVEVKKYSNTVPSAQVQKFYRDINQTPEIKAGLFVSLTSEIAGIPGSFKFKKIWESREVPVIFISSDSKELIMLACKFLFEYIKLKAEKTLSSEFYSKNLHKIKRKLEFLCKAENSILQSRKSLLDLNNIINLRIMKINEELISGETQIKKYLNKTNRIFDTIEQEKKLNLVKNDKAVNIINSIMNSITNNYSEEINLTFRKIISNILKKYKNHELSVFKSNIKISVNFKNKEIMNFIELKTKIKISVKLPRRAFEFPDCVEYKKGWCCFEISNAFIKSARDVEIIKFFS